PPIGGQFYSTIYTLVTSTELAHELALAPPSVLGMLKRLEEQGLVSYTKQTGVVLTGHGRLCADRLRRRHRLAERLLTDLLGMPWERAHDIACRFEHVIDDEVEKYLLTALNHPDTCPHGNPINSTDNKAGKSWQPLTALSPGQIGRLSRIIDESGDTLNYLRQIKLLPGVEIRVHEIAPSGGPLTVEVEGERFALSRAMADQLLVEPGENTGKRPESSHL
ncbi:MAG: metal-dependent transcriptional regulator, partial [Deltaproteobacteria bacterium]|nr:metal-dependent transcriptional regulator [Deltaproteobacteria bacterium]